MVTPEDHAIMIHNQLCSVAQLEVLQRYVKWDLVCNQVQLEQLCLS